ncbi:MAG: CatA-like O-acetyltransferase [Acidobacteriota bacterium]
MRHINLQTWSRREHFKVYSSFDHPHFGLCANVDLTVFRPFLKQRGISFTVAIVYTLARAANDIPEFRYRIRPEDVIEHEIVNPSTTILTKKDLFSFCSFAYVADFASFAAHAAEQIAYVQEHPTIENVPGKDDVLYMTAIPWISFTSFMHPMHLDPADSVPRFAWGRYFEQGERLKMPLAVQGHHALMDGIHIGTFYEQVQGYLEQPGTLLGEAKTRDLITGN